MGLGEKEEIVSFFPPSHMSEIWWKPEEELVTRASPSSPLSSPL